MSTTIHARLSDEPRAALNPNNLFGSQSLATPRLGTVDLYQE